MVHIVGWQEEVELQEVSELEMIVVEAELGMMSDEDQLRLELVTRSCESEQSQVELFHQSPCYQTLESQACHWC